MGLRSVTSGRGTHGSCMCVCWRMPGRRGNWLPSSSPLGFGVSLPRPRLRKGKEGGRSSQEKTTPHGHPLGPGSWKVGAQQHPPRRSTLMGFPQLSQGQCVFPLRGPQNKSLPASAALLKTLFVSLSRLQALTRVIEYLVECIFPSGSEKAWTSILGYLGPSPHTSYESLNIFQASGSSPVRCG